MKKNIEIKFDMNKGMDEFFKNANSCPELTSAEESIKEYFNSNKWKEQEIQRQAGIAELMPQVVGAENNHSKSIEERDYQTSIWNNLAYRLANL